MSTKEQFMSDLILGQYYEDEYIKKRKFKDVYHPKDKAFKDYDLKNKITGKTYEIKADRKAKGTGNLFVEFEFKGEDSGINATKADYWIHYITETDDVKKAKKYLKIKRKVLIQLINKNNFQVRKGGDNYLARGFLVPIEEVKKYITFV